MQAPPPSDAALPVLAVCQVRDVHHYGVSLAQVDLLQVVFVTLVLGEVDKHLKNNDKIQRPQDVSESNSFMMSSSRRAKHTEKKRSLAK